MFVATLATKWLGLQFAHRSATRSATSTTARSTPILSPEQAGYNLDEWPILGFSPEGSPVDKLAVRFILMLFLTASALAAAPQTNAADYNLAMHVIFSRTSYAAKQDSQQTLHAVVEGVPIQLMLMGSSSGLLAPGDYKARFILNKYEKGHARQKSNAYDSYDAYEILLPDGKTREFMVTGRGLAADPPASSK